MFTHRGTDSPLGTSLSSDFAMAMNCSSFLGFVESWSTSLNAMSCP